MGQPRRKDKERPEGTDTTTEAQSSADGVAVATWTAPSWPSRLTLGVITGLVILFNLPLIHYFLIRGQVPATVALPVSEDFSNPSVVEEEFFSTGGLWRVVNGELLSPGVKNNPLWLKAQLPQDVAVEFSVRNASNDDIRVEVFGDGTAHGSGYILIHTGANGRVSTLARLDEQAPPLVQAGVYTPGSRVRVEASQNPVQAGRTYRWRIERRGGLLRWLIDETLFMEFNDPYPLTGKNHDRFGFSSWESQTSFDDLVVRPL